LPSTSGRRSTAATSASRSRTPTASTRSCATSTCTLIFSDQLSFPLAIEIARRFYGRARTSFGIGTNLTNDLGYEPINIVLKMTECNGQPVAKVSDAPGKTVSKDAGYLAYLRQVFGLEPASKV
jgi:nicotinate phosphoribosyltransferase